MRHDLRATAAVALTAAVCLATAGFAQTPPTAAPAAAASDRGPEAWRARFEERAAARQKALHDILGLRPDQEAAFQAFVAQIGPPKGESPDWRRGGEDLGAMTTPQRLDAMAARLAKRQAAFARRAEATRKFYAVLSPEQQRAFDALMTLRRMDGGGRDGRRWGGGPGGRDGGPGRLGAPAQG